MRTVDGYVLPVAKKNLQTYHRMAQKAGKVWRDHGAVEVRECAGDDLKVKWGTQFPRMVRVRPRETVVFAQVNDFHNWNAWSPWAKLDPAMKQSYEGAPAGTGAIYRWAGNNEVGQGSMTITESRPSDLIRIKLEFLKPFASIATTEFTFTPEGNQTAVAWSMAGEKSFIAKAFGLFMNMDKMIGDDFEKGLAQMKSMAETASAK